MSSPEWAAISNSHQEPVFWKVAAPTGSLPLYRHTLLKGNQGFTQRRNSKVEFMRNRIGADFGSPLVELSSCPIAASFKYLGVQVGQLRQSVFLGSQRRSRAGLSQTARRLI